MVCRRTVHCMLGIAALSGIAAAQANDFAERLAQGEILRAHDRYAEARTLHATLLRDVRKARFDHRLEANVLDNLAQDDQDCGDYSAAETAFNHGLATVAGGNGDEPIQISLKTHLAELYIAENRAEDAEPLLRQSIAALQTTSRPDPVALSVADEDLAVVRIMRHKLNDTEALLHQAQALLEQYLGPDSPGLSASLLTYGGLLLAQHRYADAVEPAERAWKILNNVHAFVPKPYKASALSVLAGIYYHADRLNEAADCARQSIELAEQALGTQHPQLGFYLANYAVILRRLGRKSEAKAVQKRAESILDENPPPGAGSTVNIASLR